MSSPGGKRRSFQRKTASRCCNIDLLDQLLISRLVSNYTWWKICSLFVTKKKRCGFEEFLFSDFGASNPGPLVHGSGCYRGESAWCQSRHIPQPTKFRKEVNEFWSLPCQCLPASKIGSLHRPICRKAKWDIPLPSMAHTGAPHGDASKPILKQSCSTNKPRLQLLCTESSIWITASLPNLQLSFCKLIFTSIAKRTMFWPPTPCISPPFDRLQLPWCRTVYIRICHPLIEIQDDTTGSHVGILLILHQTFQALKVVLKIITGRAAVVNPLIKWSNCEVWRSVEPSNLDLCLWLKLTLNRPKSNSKELIHKIGQLFTSFNQPNQPVFPKFPQVTHSHLIDSSPKIPMFALAAVPSLAVVRDVLWRSPEKNWNLGPATATDAVKWRMNMDEQWNVMPKKRYMASDPQKGTYFRM